MAMSASPESEPFYNKVYVVASILDPNLKLAWIDEEVKISSDNLEEDYDIEEREQIKHDLKGKMQNLYDTSINKNNIWYKNFVSCLQRYDFLQQESLITGYMQLL